MASDYGYTNPFSVNFTVMKLKYVDYNKSIDRLNFVNPGDQINVFISFESVMNNLSLTQDLDNKLLMERNFPTIIESEMINLCAHYKRFFRDNGLMTKVYLYYTDLDSDNFVENKINEDYRSYYINKFLRNPKFQLLGNSLRESIGPRVKMIAEYIPGVYVITAKNIEGSLVPYIIARENPKAKNFIITNDKYETQYMLYPKLFCLHYLKRSKLGSSVFYHFDQYLSDLFKEEHENNPNITMFHNPPFYDLLIASLGNKIRSIDPLKGIGCKTVSKYLDAALKKGKVTNTTSAIELLKEIFPEDYHEDLIRNFSCINLQAHFSQLGEKDIFDITNQVVDRSDYNSLIQLNREYYRDYPLMLEELTC